jgi:cellulose biosynthesis protein BcsQ
MSHKVRPAWRARAARKLSVVKLRAIFGGELLFRTVIHASDRVERCAGKGAPIYLLEPRRRNAIEYSLLANEVVERGSRDVLDAVPSIDRSET